MLPLLSRAIAAVRVCLGMNDPIENHLTPSHGWLLPATADVRVRALEPVPSLSSCVSSAPGVRR